MEIKLNEMVEIKENEDVEQDTDLEIFAWAVNNGDSISKGDKLIEVMAGKTSIEVAAPVDGTVKILVEEGEIVTGDDVICEIA